MSIEFRKAASKHTRDNMKNKMPVIISSLELFGLKLMENKKHSKLMKNI
jgi:hypothetical protein